MSDDKLEKWRARAAKEIGSDPNNLILRIAKGIAISPVYTAVYLEHLSHLDSLPGETPYLHGPR